MAVAIVMPKLGMVMSEGTVNKWTKNTGDYVTSGTVLAEIETEKINYDLEATRDGYLHSVVEAGATVAVDGLIGYLLDEGEEVPSPEFEAPAPKREPRTSRRRAIITSQNPDGVKSSPGARRLAANLGIDINSVTPTGPRGRVVEQDVRDHIESSDKTQLPASLPASSKQVPMAGMRKTIADRMSSSLSDTAQLSFFVEIDVTEAQRMRREFSKNAGQKVGLPAVLIKASAEALNKIPIMNTLLHDNSILFIDQINIGLAVALDDGLIVPVLRDVLSKTVSDISDEIGTLAETAREGKLTAEQIDGGTFTVSILGSVDGFTPILNPGQSAILGAGRSVEKPVVRNKEIIIREIITISLTVDHQVIDGAIAANFIKRLQQLIERPKGLFTQNN